MPSQTFALTRVTLDKAVLVLKNAPDMCLGVIESSDGGASVGVLLLHCRRRHSHLSVLCSTLQATASYILRPRLSWKLRAQTWRMVGGLFSWRWEHWGNSSALAFIQLHSHSGC